MSTARQIEQSRIAAIRAALPKPEHYEIRLRAIARGWSVDHALQEAKRGANAA